MSARPDPALLRKAAEIIEERGLHRGGFLEPHKGKECCTWGALYLAAGSPAINYDRHGDNYFTIDDGAIPEETEEIVWATRKFLDQRLGMNVTSWNDAPERTAEEVTTLLRTAADELEGAQA